jgi:hypothetical protein
MEVGENEGRKKNKNIHGKEGMIDLKEMGMSRWSEMKRGRIGEGR